MPSGPKIAFIGAGSATFTRMLIGDILGYEALREATLSLHDIDDERLETAVGVARLTAEEAGAAPRIEASADRRTALEGCDYAINMVQVGGHAATLIDHEIPLPKSTAAITRSGPDGTSPGTTGTFSRTHASTGPG